MSTFRGKPRTVVYVDPSTGTLNGPGSWKNPVTRISTAAKIVGAAGGGTIRVRSTSGAPVIEPSSILTFYSSTDIVVESWDNTNWYLTGTLRCYGDGLVTLRNGIITASGGYAVTVGVAGGSFGTTGRLVATDCRAETTNTSSTGTAWNGQAVWTSIDLTNCYGKGAGNDGFGFDADSGLAPVATLTNCEADSCREEGASNHTNTVMHLIGGSFHDCGESGMHVINSAVCTIFGGSFYNNGALGDSGTIGNAGARYRDSSSGSIGGGASFTNNVGAGVDLDTAGVVTLGTYTSTGNGAPDDLT